MGLRWGALDLQSGTVRVERVAVELAGNAGGSLRRTVFRARIWRPSLVDVRLLGKVREPQPGVFVASWLDKEPPSQQRTLTAS